MEIRKIQCDKCGIIKDFKDTKPCFRGQEGWTPLDNDRDLCPDCWEKYRRLCSKLDEEKEKFFIKNREDMFEACVKNE